MSRRFAIGLLAILGSACVQGLDTPEPTPLVPITGGTFVFGSTAPCFPEDKPTAGCKPNENPFGMPKTYPVVQVQLPGFAIEQHEVTNYQYEYCVAKGACREPFAFNIPNFVDDYYGNKAYRDYPVVNVTVEMAEEYCRFVGRRLPTEVEWERVAGGAAQSEATKRKYGYDADTGDIRACQNRDITMRYCNGALGPAAVMTSSDDVVHEGGQPIYDLTGNVAEWVAGRFQEDITCKKDLSNCPDCFACDQTPDPTQCKETCYLDSSCPDCANDPDCFRQCDDDPTVFPGIPRCISYGEDVQDAKDLVVETGPEALAKGGSYADAAQQTCRARVSDRNRHLVISETTTKSYFIGFRCAADL